MIRALLILASLTLTACTAGKTPFEGYETPPAQLALLEQRNVAQVEAAADGCELQEAIYAVGVDEFDIAEDVAETESEITLLLMGLCIKDSVAVFKAAEGCQTVPGTVPGAEVIKVLGFGRYTYQPGFVAAQGSKMPVFDQCMMETLAEQAETEPNA